jgi:hypothetical protein
MVFIYVLLLEKNKYYIGKSKFPNERIDDHKFSIGSSWTSLYKPIKIIDIISNCDDYDEDKYTIKYMGLYGIENVRGGSFCEIKLNNENKEIIKKMINGSENKCFNCGKNEHFANNCIENNKIFDNRCFRCGRKGHYESNCYANTSIDGKYINDSDDSEYYYLCDFCGKEFDTEKGCKYHENFYCKQRP